MTDEIKNDVKQPSISPTTTVQQDMTLAGQRKVNMVWEVTQAIIAVSITIAVLFTTVYSVLSPFEQAGFPDVLSNAFFLIVGFYFSRTNHQAIGGIGPRANETQEYRGR